MDTTADDVAIEVEPIAPPAAPAASAAGTAARIADVVDAHGQFVGRTLRCLGVRESDLKDACQEVFLVAHRRLHQFEGRASLRTWLYAICVRRALSHRRTAARRREDAVAEVPEPSHDAPPLQEAHVDGARALALALQILDGLDHDKRAVFVLHEVEQLPMSEIAEMVECPLQTAYSRLYAARRDIARALERHRAKRRSP